MNIQSINKQIDNLGKKVLIIEGVSKIGTRAFIETMTYRQLLLYENLLSINRYITICIFISAKQVFLFQQLQKYSIKIFCSMYYLHHYLKSKINQFIRGQ